MLRVFSPAACWPAVKETIPDKLRYNCLSLVRQFQGSAYVNVRHGHWREDGKCHRDACISSTVSCQENIMWSQIPLVIHCQVCLVVQLSRVCALGGAWSLSVLFENKYQVCRLWVYKVVFIICICVDLWEREREREREFLSLSLSFSLSLSLSPPPSPPSPLHPLHSPHPLPLSLSWHIFCHNFQWLVCLLHKSYLLCVHVCEQRTARARPHCWSTGVRLWRTHPSTCLWSTWPCLPSWRTTTWSGARPMMRSSSPVSLVCSETEREALHVYVQRSPW